jgi:hypothetical protein
MGEAMASRQRTQHWGLKAAACAAIVAWQIYEVASQSVFSPNEGNFSHYLIIAAALCGLVVSLLKLNADD